MSGLYRNLLKTNTKYGAAAATGAASGGAASAPVRSPVAAAAAATATATAAAADPPATDVERPLRPNPQVSEPTWSWEVVSHFPAGVVLSDAFE